MKKYRIKLRTYKDGRIVFIPQVRYCCFFYKQIGHDGDPSFVYESECDFEKIAMSRIEKHKKGKWRFKYVITSETFLKL